jgi:hypothetical protein
LVIRVTGLAAGAILAACAVLTAAAPSSAAAVARRPGDRERADRRDAVDP